MTAPAPPNAPVWAPVWRSPLHGVMEDAGAALVACGDGLIADTVPGGNPALAEVLGIADLSARPRFGVKGPAALAWLGEAGHPAKAANNRWQSASGIAVAQLSPAEALIFPAANRQQADDHIRSLENRHRAAMPTGCHHLPRRDSHTWLRITGHMAPAFFARLCAVDLRPGAFPADGVAQTSVALTSAIVVRRDVSGRAGEARATGDGSAGGIPAYDLFADTASAVYLWGVFVKVAAELGGGPIGYADLCALSG